MRCLSMWLMSCLVLSAGCGGGGGTIDGGADAVSDGADGAAADGDPGPNADDLAPADPVCSRHASWGCFQGDVYWLDSCGNLEEIKEPCTDENPCTADSCDPQTGCLRVVVADGSPCPGRRIPCQALPVCLAGACTEVVPEEGSPCSDGDLCTVADAGRQGACVGLLPEGDPVRVGGVGLFGSNSSARTASLGPVSYLVADDFPLVFSTVELSREGELHLSDQWTFDGHNRAGQIHPVGEGRFATLISGTGAHAYPNAVLFQVEEGGLQPLSQVYVGQVDIWCSSWNWIGTAAYQDAFYVCDENHVRVFDFASRTEAGPLPLGEACRSLAVDASRQRLFAGTVGAGLAVFDLAEPGRPVEVGGAFPEKWIWNLATDGAVLLAHEYVDISGDILHVVDPESLGVLSTLAGHNISDLARHDEGFAVARWLYDRDEIELWSFADPARPVRLAAEARYERVSNSSGDCRLAGGGGEVVFPLGRLGLEPRRMDGQALVPVSGPRLGRLADIHPAGGERWAGINSDGAWVFDLSDPAAPVAFAGGIWQKDAALFSLSPGGAPPTHLLSRVRRVSGQAPLGWMDVSDAAAPRPLGNAFFPDSRCRVLGGDGRVLAALAYSPSGEGVWLEIYLWGEQTPAEPAGLVPAAEIPLPTDASDCNPYYLSTVFFDGDRVLAAINWGDKQGTVDLVLVDLASPRAPRVVASKRLSRGYSTYAVDARLAGDLLAVLETSPDGDSSAVLRTFLAGEDEIEERGELNLGSHIWYWSERILHLDRKAALLATGWLPPLKLVWVDVEAAPPAVVAEIPLGDVIRSLQVFRDHLVLAHDNELVLLYPPCPPP